jgi:hypothetical protein
MNSLPVLAWRSQRKTFRCGREAKKIIQLARCGKKNFFFSASSLRLTKNFAQLSSTLPAPPTMVGQAMKLTRLF